MPRIVIVLAGLLATAAVGTVLLSTTPSGRAASSVQTKTKPKPNIVVIETDDQTAASIAYCRRHSR